MCFLTCSIIEKNRNTPYIFFGKAYAYPGWNTLRFAKVICPHGGYGCSDNPPATEFTPGSAIFLSAGTTYPVYLSPNTATVGGNPTNPLNS